MFLFLYLFRLCSAAKKTTKKAAAAATSATARSNNNNSSSNPGPVLSVEDEWMDDSYHHNNNNPTTTTSSRNTNTTNQYNSNSTSSVPGYNSNYATAYTSHSMHDHNNNNNINSNISTTTSRSNAQNTSNSAAPGRQTGKTFGMNVFLIVLMFLIPLLSSYLFPFTFTDVICVFLFIVGAVAPTGSTPIDLMDDSDNNNNNCTDVDEEAYERAPITEIIAARSREQHSARKGATTATTAKAATAGNGSKKFQVPYKSTTANRAASPSFEDICSDDSEPYVPHSRKKSTARRDSNDVHSIDTSSDEEFTHPTRNTRQTTTSVAHSTTQKHSLLFDRIGANRKGNSTTTAAASKSINSAEKRKAVIDLDSSTSNSSSESENDSYTHTTLNTHYTSNTTGTAATAATATTTHLLSKRQQAAFTEWLKEYRKKWVSYWNYLSNPMITDIVRTVPTTMDELASVPGIGASKARLNGDGILCTIYAFLEHNDLLHLFPNATFPTLPECPTWRDPFSEEADIIRSFEQDTANRNNNAIVNENRRFSYSQTQPSAYNNNTTSYMDESPEKAEHHDVSPFTYQPTATATATAGGYSANAPSANLSTFHPYKAPTSVTNPVATTTTSATPAAVGSTATASNYAYSNNYQANSLKRPLPSSPAVSAEVPNATYGTIATTAVNNRPVPGPLPVYGSAYSSNAANSGATSSVYSRYGGSAQVNAPPTAVSTTPSVGAYPGNPAASAMASAHNTTTPNVGFRSAGAMLTNDANKKAKTTPEGDYHQDFDYDATSYLG